MLATYIIKKISSSHIRKAKKKQVKLILVLYFIHLKYYNFIICNIICTFNLKYFNISACDQYKISEVSYALVWYCFKNPVCISY